MMILKCVTPHPNLTLGKTYKSIKVKSKKTYIHKDNGKLEWINYKCFIRIRTGIHLGSGNDRSLENSTSTI